MASVIRCLRISRTSINKLQNLVIPTTYRVQCCRLSSGTAGGSDGEGVYHPPADMEPPIPEYKARNGEGVTVQRARLLYQSRKRGMLENGLLLSTFAAKYLDGMTDKQLQIYDTLINKPTNDWDIYAWATGNKPTPEEYSSEIMDMLKEHAANEDMEVRLRQPDL